MWKKSRYQGAALMMLMPLAGWGQLPVPDTSQVLTRTVIAGDYDHGRLYTFFFGKHYRREWTTPVKAPVLMLDTVFGGLSPYEAGGGRQSKTLRLRDTCKREYVLRSLDKSFGRALPEVLQGGFVEHLIDDQVTIGHPYAAFTIPAMAQAAGIYHTLPVIYYVPAQRALDSFNADYGDQLYLLEQRPDEDWTTAPNFGSSENIVGTDKLFERLLESARYRVDQQMYVRCRLFDLVIGDWGRHEDQWRWASFESGTHTLFQPIPRDRDQAYTRFDGTLVKLVLSAANLDHLQSFDEDIDDIKTYSFAARHLDRRLMNEVVRDDWIRIAGELQQALTDSVIETAVRKMPAEVFPLSGEAIIAKLKGRRNRLADYAGAYYDFLARHVDIPGTVERDYFDVRRLGDSSTEVKVFAMDSAGVRADTPFYRRRFVTGETRDIRLYGIDGPDSYRLQGKVDQGITIRIIGGRARDSIMDRSEVADDRGKTAIYDDFDNYIARSGETKLRLSSDTAVHTYDYREFEHHKRGLKLSIFYDNPDRLYVGAGYGFKRHMWRRKPYGFEQALYIRYSLSQNAFSLLYEGWFKKVIGKWDGRIWVNQDFIRWTNFYGLGNETKNLKEEVANRYYQLRTDEFLGSVGLVRTFRSHHTVDLTAFFSAVEIVDDPGRFVSQHYTPYDLYFFEHHKYAGARAGYTFQNVDHPAIPEKGIMVYAGAAYTHNVEEGDKGFATYNGILQLYLPLVNKFSLSLRAGLASVDGRPEFYQYTSVGGSQTLRGYRRDRFWGKTSFYNTNELRWITDIRSFVMNGKAGVVAFLDQGRVWMPLEKSDNWHMGYGGGFLLAPFNFVTASVTYGLSEDGGRFHIRVSRMLK